MFRPRLAFRMEEVLEANRNNPSFLYEALKVYLMLGGRAEAPLDRNLVVGWFRRDWAENLYPGAGFARGRQLLEDNLQAMLDLDDGSPPLSIPASELRAKFYARDGIYHAALHADGESLEVFYLATGEEQGDMAPIALVSRLAPGKWRLVFSLPETV